MEEFNIIGKAHVYGDNINTDVIIPGKYTKTLDLNSLAAHVLEDLDPEFRNRLKHGDILVAGDNFGCGSSREQAPVALKAAGVSVVIANYFARIFFRNAINVGLPVLEVKNFVVESGDEVGVDLKLGLVKNMSNNQIFSATRMPEVMIYILNEGGLVNYLKRVGGYNIDK
jgi:3-isopropylmalate dehydratase small subunit